MTQILCSIKYYLDSVSKYTIKIIQSLLAKYTIKIINKKMLKNEKYSTYRLDVPRKYRLLDSVIKKRSASHSPGMSAIPKMLSHSLFKKQKLINNFQIVFKSPKFKDFNGKTGH